MEGRDIVLIIMIGMVIVCIRALFFGGCFTSDNVIKETPPTDPCALSNIDACWKGCIMMQKVTYGENGNHTQEDFANGKKEYCRCAKKCGLEFDKDDTEYYNESYC